MRRILVLGAGRSSSSLIAYLLQHASASGWKVIVADSSLKSAQLRVGDASQGTAVAFDLSDDHLPIMQNCDLIISLLPPHLHPVVARYCLQLKKHLITASYVSDEMKSLHGDALSNGLLFLNECGLDPGIDHMSAVKIIDEVNTKGGKLISFESFTGGLIAPETDPENPWRYKFTWNPRNVVMAGQGTAKYMRDGEVKYIPYQQLFKRTAKVNVPGLGDLEGYANRDSLKYIDTYHLHGIKTMLRGTLRYEGFCAAWNILVQLGCCDDSYEMENVASMTHSGFLNAFLSGSRQLSVEKRLLAQFGLKNEGPEMNRLRWSGFFSEDAVGLSGGSPAKVLEHILNKKWSLSPSDKDMIVMVHRFIAEFNGKQQTIQSSLVVKGDDSVHTAMAKTVGLPLGISAKLLLEDKISVRGVAIPTHGEIYRPVLSELEKYGIRMEELVS